MQAVLDLTHTYIRTPRIDLENLLHSSRTAFSNITHGLQFQNMEELFAKYGGFVKDGLMSLPKGNITVFDAGNGDGLLLALYEEWVMPQLKRLGSWSRISSYLPKNGLIKDILWAINEHIPWEYFDDDSRAIGTDINPKKTDRSQRLNDLINKETGRNHLVLDPNDLSQMDIHNCSAGGKFDRDTRVYTAGTDYYDLTNQNIGLIVCNSVFHWIRGNKRKIEALKNFYAILEEEGSLLMSVASYGTAKTFLKAYRSALKDIGAWKANSPEISNPIGLMYRHEAANMAREAGFEVISCEDKETKVGYSDPEEYLKSVYIYGFYEFTKVLDSKGMDLSAKKRWWNEVLAPRFLEDARAEMKNGVWEYHQSNIYLIAKK
ncbi:MAG: hypothetical protein NDI94_02320 [Candidatus Woesearchaeota archaeon]|nr:hypothetical protein [Candidatus Woesearchaeota archaeon]